MAGTFWRKGTDSARVTSRSMARAKPAASASRLAGRAGADGAGREGREHPGTAAARWLAVPSVAGGADVADQPCGCGCSSADGS